MRMIAFQDTTTTVYHLLPYSLDVGGRMTSCVAMPTKRDTSFFFANSSGLDKAYFLKYEFVLNKSFAEAYIK